jgi:putative endonuclease
MAAKDVLGRRGEDLAAHHLQQQGLVILSRNWRCHRGELDLVATDRSKLVVVCEVKTRSAARFGSPAEAVGRAKARRIRQVTQLWLATHQVRWVEIRFDVVAVVAEPGRPVEITHYRGAF